MNHADRERVLVSVSLHYTPGVDAPDKLRERLQTLFPRLYDCFLVPTRTQNAIECSSGTEQIDLSKVEQNATDYVARKVNDRMRDDVLAALKSLFRPANDPDGRLTLQLQEAEA